MVLLELSLFIILKDRLHCKTELNSTVIADKEQGPKTIQSLGLDLGYTKTAVRDPATYNIHYKTELLNSTVELSFIV